jgi:hypothetical protein
MKTTIYILTALFVMNFTFLSAGNQKIIIVKANGTTFRISHNPNNSDLALVVPKEALFNDSEPRPSAEINRLAPITPKEATFEDGKVEFPDQPLNSLLLEKFAPITPKEAEFEDSSPEKKTDIDLLAPISPLIASFED